MRFPRPLLIDYLLDVDVPALKLGAGEVPELTGDHAGNYGDRNYGDSALN